jgi:hypothetical protein
MEYQTSGYVTGTEQHNSLENALNLMREDPTIWKLSYSYGDVRYRWIITTKKDLKTWAAWNEIKKLCPEINNDNVDDATVFMTNQDVLERYQNLPDDVNVIHHVLKKTIWEAKALSGEREFN